MRLRSLGLLICAISASVLLVVNARAQVGVWTPVDPTPPPSKPAVQSRIRQYGPQINPARPSVRSNAPMQVQQAQPRYPRQQQFGPRQNPTPQVQSRGMQSMMPPSALRQPQRPTVFSNPNRLHTTTPTQNNNPFADQRPISSTQQATQGVATQPWVRPQNAVIRQLPKHLPFPLTQQQTAGRIHPMQRPSAPVLPQRIPTQPNFGNPTVGPRGIQQSSGFNVDPRLMSPQAQLMQRPQPTQPRLNSNLPNQLGPIYRPPMQQAPRNLQPYPTRPLVNQQPVPRPPFRPSFSPSNVRPNANLQAPRLFPDLLQPIPQQRAVNPIPQRTHRVEMIPTEIPRGMGPLPTNQRAPGFQPNEVGRRPISQGSIFQTQAVEPTQLTIPRQMTPPGIRSQDHVRNQPTLRFPDNASVRQSVQPRPPVEPNAPGTPYPSGPLPGPLAIQPVPIQPQPNQPQPNQPQPPSVVSPRFPKPPTPMVGPQAPWVPSQSTYPEFAPPGQPFVEGTAPCVSGECSPGSDCFSCDLFADVRTYAWLQGRGGEEYGIDQDWYTQLGFFSPLAFFENERAVLFFQGNVQFGEERSNGATVGMGYRQYEFGRDSIIGASLWYDVENNPSRTFHQLGVSFENYSRAHEFRVNGYLPLGETRHFQSTSPRFIDNNILVGIDEFALAGFDMELGAPIPGVPQLWAHGGYYYYIDREDNLEHDQVHGIRGRLEYRLAPNVQFNAIFSHDEVFESSIFGMFSIAFRTPGQVLDDGDPCATRPRIDRLVYRKQLTLAEQNRVARNVVTDQPIFVAQVSEAFGSPNGTGTTDNPFDSISAAATAAGQHGIVFVRDGSFDESVALLNHQRLLGDGFLDTNPHQVITHLGTILLPGQNAQASVVTPSISSSDRTGTIKLCQDDSFVDDVEIAGFTITNSVGSGIFGIQNEGFSIHNNTIEQSAETGITLLNAAGTQFNNSTAPQTNNLISNNVIQDNSQSGVVLANLNFNTLDLNPVGVDLSSKTISLANRGDLEVDISNNTFTNNATDANSSALINQIQTQTFRDDHFALYVASTTNSTSTVNASNNTFTGNGAPSAFGQVDSTGGVGILAGGSSQISASITDSTFTGNFGTDIHNIVGNGPTTSSTARVDVDVLRNFLSDTQLAQTENGVLAAGIRGIATTGFLNLNVGSNVIQGSQTILDARQFDGMDAFYLISEGNAQINANIIDAGLNPLGRVGNEFSTWHVGVGSNVEGTGVTNLLIQDALIDAECVLKLHGGLDGNSGTTGRMNVDVVDSNLIVRLPATTIVDGTLAEAVGAAQLNLTLNNVTTRFEGVVPAVALDRDWLTVRTAGTGRLNLTLNNVAPTNLMTGLQDFIEYRMFDNSIATLNVSDSLIGQTQGFGIDIVTQDSSRLTQTITNTSFGGNGLGLIDASITDDSVLTSALTSNVFQSPSNTAIRIFGESYLASQSSRIGATFDGNSFQVAPQTAIQLIGSSPTSGNTVVRANLINNSSDGNYLLEQLQSNAGTTQFDVFSSGNTGNIITSGSVTPSLSTLSIVFP